MSGVVGAIERSKFDAGVVHALLQARYYDSGKGEFLSEDPVFLGDPKQQVLTDPQSLNSYSYANDNPITRKDPDGRLGEQALPALAGAAAVLVLVYPYLTPSQQHAVGAAIVGLGQPVQGIGRSMAGASAGSYPIGVRSGTGVQTNVVPWGNINLSAKKDTDQYGSLPTADDLRGKSPAEVDKILKDKGLSPEAGRGKGVTRYPVPGRQGDQVIVEPGNPNDPNPVKQGPYGRVSQDGQRSDPFPLEGNPTLNSQ
jgi:RHS repeat-associated protein